MRSRRWLHGLLARARGRGEAPDGPDWPGGLALESLLAGLGPAPDASAPRLDRLLGRQPLPLPLDPEEDADQTGDGLVCQRVSFQTCAGLRTAAHLWRRQDLNGPAPVVLAIHGHGGNLVQGKGKISQPHPDSPTYGYGRLLARRGFVVLAPDLPGFEESRLRPLPARVPWPRDMERLLFCSLLLHGSTLAGLCLFCLSRAVDYLSLRPDLADLERLCVLGHSMGGSLAPLFMLYDQRARAGVAAAGLGTWQSLIAGQVVHNLAVYLPGLLAAGDLDQLLAGLAPRPLMVIAGERDPNFPLEGVRALARALGQAYGAAGAPGALAVEVHPGGHPFETGQQELAAQFLDRWLRAGAPEA